jgi:hypothetical protein
VLSRKRQRSAERSDEDLRTPGELLIADVLEQQKVIVAAIVELRRL